MESFYADCTVRMHKSLENLTKEFGKLRTGRASSTLVEGIKWSLCPGIYRGNVYFSVRTTNMKLRADRIVQNMVKRIGSAGGHDMVAAGKIDCDLVVNNDCNGVIQTLISRFLKGVKREGIEGRPL